MFQEPVVESYTDLRLVIRTGFATQNQPTMTMSRNFPCTLTAKSLSSFKARKEALLFLYQSSWPMIYSRNGRNMLSVGQNRKQDTGMGMGKSKNGIMTMIRLFKKYIKYFSCCYCTLMY